jgi:Domain of unknown function (DUF4407)
MCARRSREPSLSRFSAALTWLGGGHWRELVVVLINAALAWLVATLAVTGSTDWPVWAILPLTLLFGMLVGVVSRAVASGPARGWSVLGRAAVAVLVGVVVGELAAVVMFSGSIDRRIDEQAARQADSTPVVAQATSVLDRIRDQRTALDASVDAARVHRDQALVVARCEYNPTPACPQTRITGVPGPGPETQTSNELLADTQRELDNAIAARDRQSPALDSDIAGAERELAQARQTAIANADRGLGARWVAMHDHTLASAGALVLWALTIAFFALLSLVPMILRLMRGETTQDRDTSARAKRDRADIEADTAIAVKRAEVRAEIETMWADQQLASTRLAIDAQNQIDRELHRRRIAEALATTTQITAEPVEEDMYLPIAAEAEAASRAAALPPGKEKLPARVEEERGTRIPTIPNVTKTAARWIRPFVPPIVARALDTTTQPLRTARQVFEEVEEVTFSFKRTYKASVDSEESVESTHQTGRVRPDSGTQRIDSTRLDSSRLDSSRPEHGAVETGGHEVQPELGGWDGPGALSRGHGSRELPPAE